MTEMRRYMGAILAAGHGKRMGEFSKRFPKPLLPVCNQPLIQYQIEILRDLGIRDILILVGHKGYEIAKTLGDGSLFNVRLRYVEQTEMLGIAHAVGCLEPHVDRPVLLFLGDIFFVPGDLKEMLYLFEEQGGGAVLAVKEEPDLKAIRKNYSVTLDDDGYVRRVIEKPRHPVTALKGVGLYLFDVTLFDAIRRTPRTAMRNEYEITESIQVMIDDLLPVRVARAILDDINITTPTDLLRCNLAHAQHCAADSLVGAEVELHPDARVENSVIGAHVTVRHPINIKNSVIFPDTLINATCDFDGFVITPDLAVDCREDTGLVQENL